VIKSNFLSWVIRPVFTDSVTFNEVLKVSVTIPEKTQKKNYTAKARRSSEDAFIVELKEEGRKRRTEAN